MSKPAILCIDDQREVLAALVKDLDPLSEFFYLVDCESANEALEVLDESASSGNAVALIISDHVMPGTSGVDLLSKVRADKRYAGVRMLLLTGLATHDDTIRAINEAKINSYIAKPWQPEQLLAEVKKLVTGYLLDADPDGYQKYMAVIDNELLMERLAQRGAPNVN